MPPVDKDLTAPAWIEKAPLSPNSLYPAELNPSPGAPMMFGPNITGTWHHGSSTDTASTGAVTDTGDDRRKGLERISAYLPVNKSFDASRSNSTYGNAQTVQPAALMLLPCIKT